MYLHMHCVHSIECKLFKGEDGFFFIFLYQAHNTVFANSKNLIYVYEIIGECLWPLDEFSYFRFRDLG